MRIADPLCGRVDNPVRMYPTPLVVLSTILVYLQMAGVVLVNYVPFVQAPSTSKDKPIVDEKIERFIEIPRLKMTFAEQRAGSADWQALPSAIPWDKTTFSLRPNIYPVY